ncbi:MAG TPA: tRNA (adenosine(37)-N6)-dimethylallyltransferase MiaA [Rickettsiales bacterium]|nr:tRNA (adenosine(37)-N6)-dimethylallyltransferase MiaA [Rickettsiales bacterium]
MHSITIICGATASGKSAYALDIAQNIGGVIINADAMQVYRELDIVTARPTPEQENIAPHLLYGVLSASEKCSAARWLEMAKQAIDETLAKGKIPLITGGTGLYIKTLIEGLSPIPDVPENCRKQAEMLWREYGAQALAEHDPEMHARLKLGDMQRHIRALGVWLATGKSLAYWQTIPRERPYPDAVFDIKHVELPRDELYRRCDMRFLSMMENGALEEAKALHALNLSSDMPAARAVGVPELFAYLEGKCTLEEAVSKAQQATRNYAKRQMTWFRHQLK